MWDLTEEYPLLPLLVEFTEPVSQSLLQGSLSAARI